MCKQIFYLNALKVHAQSHTRKYISDVLMNVGMVLALNAADDNNVDNDKKVKSV